jgi:hypothetical protein
MNNAKKAKKRERFTGVQKRSTYNEMKESDNKAKTFAVMLKNNPKILDYFTKKNGITRTPELAKIIVWTEQYARKEHARSPLYSIVEKYKKDKKFKHPSAQKEIKKLIQDTIAYCKSTNSDEYKAVLKVLESVNKKEIDTNKIFHDKEWYRPLVKTLGAMGIGAYLMGKAFWAVPETELHQPIVEEVQHDDSCEKSLNLCLAALNGLKEDKVRKVDLTKMPTRNVYVTKMPDKDEYCKEYLDEINELREMFKDGEAALMSKIDGLNKELIELKKKDHHVNLRLHLLSKLDEKFTVTDKEGREMLYPSYRKLWKQRLENNDKSAYITLIMLGDYFLAPDLKDGIVRGLYGHGQRMPNGRIADIRDAIRKGNYVYIAGVWRNNDMPGTTKGFIDVVEKIYKYYKGIHGTGPWAGKLE